MRGQAEGRVRHEALARVGQAGHVAEVMAWVAWHGHLVLSPEAQPFSLALEITMYERQAEDGILILLDGASRR